MLVRCLYASQAAVPLDATVIETILETSRRNNDRLGITGLLCHNDDVFIQVLEGDRGKVSLLYNTIVQDKRHHHVTLLSYGETAERRFADWSMGEVNLTAVDPALLLKHTRTEAFEPQELPGETVMALLDELGASAPRLARSA